MRLVHKTTINGPREPGPAKPEPRKRSLVAELRDLLGVGAQMARALARSHDPGWQQDMIEKYGGRLSAWEREDLWCRIRLYDPDEDEERFEKG